MFNNILFFGRYNCNYSDKLSKYLKKHSNNLIFIKSKKRNEKLKLKKIKNKKLDFIFCYRSFYILKKKLIDQSKYGAINFHPGTPNFRGIGAVNFAILNQCSHYGSTAHYINEKIDSGKIIDVTKFQLRKKESVDKVLSRTHQIMFKQAIKIFENLFKNKNYYLKKKSKYQWSKKLYTIKDLEKLYEIKSLDNRVKLDRIIQATYTKSFKPYLKINKRKFFLINFNENI